MNNPEPTQQNPSVDPSSESSEPQRSGEPTPDTIDWSNETVNTGRTMNPESHEEEQKINIVDGENQYRTPSIKQPGSSGETSRISETWLSKAEADEMRTRWNAIQFQFVDSPCSAVEQGDTLVAEAIEHITEILSGIQISLNQQWINHDDISTEELRHTLQNYRTVLNRLLSL
jgi:hypothetical protein